MYIDRLDRSVEYFDGLQKRLGWDVRDGKSMLVHLAGVSFRQEALAKAQQLCTFEWTPSVRLEPEKAEDQKGYTDADAVRVYIGTEVNDLTGEATEEHIGYLPKKRCPVCAKTYSGKRATDTFACKECDTELEEGEWAELALINGFVRRLLEAGTELQVGLDNVTSSQTSAGNLGCDIWVRLP